MTTFIAQVIRGPDRKGRLNLKTDYNRDRFQQFLDDNIGKDVKIERKETKRSLSQNALYWVYLQAIEIETGNLATDLHEYFKRALLPPKFITVMGKEIKVPRSTTELTKPEFTEYMMKINALTNVPVPRPEDAGYISNK